MDDLAFKLTKNTLISAVGRVFGIIATLISTALLTRALGSEDFGVYSFILAFAATFYVIADFGFGQLLAREIARAVPDDEREKTLGTLFTLRLGFLFVSLGAAPVAALAMGYAPSVIYGIIIGAAAYLFISLAQLLMGIFQWALRMHYVAFAEFGARLVQLGAVLAAYISGVRDITAFLLIFAAGFCAQFLMLAFWARRITPMRPHVDTRRLRAMLGEALPIGISLMLVYVYFRADAIILAFFHPGSPVGFYNLAYRVLENLIFFPAMFVGLVFPKLSAAWTADKAQFRALFRRTRNILLVAAPLALVGTFIFAPLVTSVLGGAEFSPATDALRILSIAIALIFLATLPGQAVVAMGIQKKAVWLYFMGAALNVTLNLIFIPRYSYLATSWTTVATEAVVTAGLYCLVWKEMKS